MNEAALHYLSLARKAGKAELGEEPAGAAARAHKAYVLIVASDASDHTWRRAQSFVSGTEQQCLRLPFTKDQMGQSIGRTSLALAAITDPALALALVKALDDPRKYAGALAVLEEKAQRQSKRRSEAKAHRRNKQMGLKHRKKEH